jgi:tRNA (guanine-N7-)-methyltransferase
VGKNKLQKYARTLEYASIIQPTKEELFNSFDLKGKWHERIFKNQAPIVLELGAGKGEYSLMMAEKYPHKNFIAVDIKGDRLLKGAVEADEKNITNLKFLRIQIENIHLAFGHAEVQEIWITFPDPFLKKRKRHKRMTSQKFLEKYLQIITNQHLIHLKTDSTDLYDYTREVLAETHQEILYESADVYDDMPEGEVTALQTYYEKKWLAQGDKIKYLQFRLKK